MRKTKLAIAAAVVTGSLALPAMSSAQGTDVGTLCNSLIGSGTTVLGPVAFDRCLAASDPRACRISDTIYILNLARIRTGICLVLFPKTGDAGVDGVAVIRLLP